MADRRFHGEIKHTEHTVEQLYKTQYYAYEKPRILIRLGIGLALAAVAITAAIPTWAKAILLLLGCWLMASKDFPSQIQADRAMQARKAALPDMRYDFREDHVYVTGEGSMNIKYKKFTRLVQDEKYLYLFLAKDSLCMLERESLRPDGAENFMAFIEEKTGLSWRREKSLLSMNLWDVKQLIKDHKQRK